MLSVNKALSTIKKRIKPLSVEEKGLLSCQGEILREDIYASFNIPQKDNSAMDGYALRCKYTEGATFENPRIFKVIDEVRAGSLSKKIVKANTATRIMTGAFLPRGADSVVKVEDTAEFKKGREIFLKVFKPIERGENVREKGEDIKKGKKVISSGTFLDAVELGVLASLGKSRVKVTKKIKASFFVSGDEVIDPGKPLPLHKIYSSNTYTIYGQLTRLGVECFYLGIVKDNLKSIESKLKEAKKSSDIIITSGGVSMGRYDFIKEAFSNLGGKIIFEKVAIRPGKPFVFGVFFRRNKEIPFFGLPGNPVSSLVCFEIFVKPAILKMQARKDEGYFKAKAILEEDIKKKKGFTFFLRANTYSKGSRLFTKTTGPQGSGILTSFLGANSLMILDEKKTFLSKGEEVEVHFLR